MPPEQSPGDEAEVTKALSQASTWGKAEAVRHLLTSCYCTPASALPALAEAASKGHTDVVAVLLEAKASPAGLDHGKTAFHRAMEEGQEECARLLIDAMREREEAYIETPAGHTALDLARQQELGGCARRAEAHINAKFGE